MVHIESFDKSGPFDFRWPKTLEHFVAGWEGAVVLNGRRSRFRHGVGERQVYGRLRPHTVTFLDEQPVVEGVAADDYDQSKGLLSLLKLGSGHALVRDLTEVDPAYANYEIVSHADEIRAPYSRRSVALKIRVDDLDKWLLHASVRRSAQGRVP